MKTLSVLLCIFSALVYALGYIPDAIYFMSMAILFSLNDKK